MPTTKLTAESGSIIYAGEHRITREKPERYKIYLPKVMNLLWRDLRSRKVRVYLVVSDES